MAYNWDKTKPLGTQPGADMDDGIRDTRAGTEVMVGTEHTVDVSNPTNVSAKHSLGSARAGYDLAANKPTTGSGIETGRIFVASDTKNVYVGNGSAVVGVDADTVDGAHAGVAANNALVLDGSGLVPKANATWAVQGPTSYRIQTGQAVAAFNGVARELTLSVTFPVPFGGTPRVVANVARADTSTHVYVETYNTNFSAFGIRAYGVDSVPVAINFPIDWIAVGLA